ncbi:MAG: hypothetical protein KKD73_01195 [Proteobacteria bacterium]|nr:hypothetical protein [Pseudomonadota bacterium]MBU1641113.1 hypothetical protein [Pseudomonadota bacterium]
MQMRETISVISDYKNNDFKHISMTDMLLKLTIENLNESKIKNLHQDLILLKNEISIDSSKFKKVKEVNKLIKDRELYTISKADIAIYEEFLSYIQEYYHKIKSIVQDNVLGKILQDLGDNARRCGNPIDYETKFDKTKAGTLFILAKEANNIIKFYRTRKREQYKIKTYKEFVIEAFRNPYEAEYFRNRYYEFFLFSINSQLKNRAKRANWNQDRDSRDQGHKIKSNEFYKQNVSKCVFLSDISINNDDNTRILKRKLSRYFSLLCQPGCITPSSDEMFMHQAYTLSLKSNCISRQVGAIIIGPEGYIVGAGWNDVGSGQIPCGLRRVGDLDCSENPFPIAPTKEAQNFVSFIQLNATNPTHNFCYKDSYSMFTTTKKTDNLTSLSEWESKHEISPEAHTELSSLITSNLSPKRLEYCRALHAEENAILQNAILGGVGIKGGTIFSTTFPCELCAKKIYQSGIKKVVYTEPYPESISEDVFFKDGSHIVQLEQFEGVKSHSYYRLYKATVDRKEFQYQESI